MADFTADFEAGSNGATITTGGGEASATAWNTVTGSPTYSNTHFAHGALAAKFSSSGQLLLWNNSLDETYGRVYLYATANPGSAETIIEWVGTSQDCEIYITTGGLIALRSGVDASTITGSVAISLNQWVRIEYRFAKVPISGATGTFQVKLFNTADSTTVSETIGGVGDRNTGALQMASVSFGRTRYGPWGSDIWLDDILANATAYPGPWTAPPQFALPTADSVDGSWTDQAGGTSLYAALSAESDAAYIKSELAPANSSCRVKLDSTISDPASSSGHIIHWRPGKDTTGGATINMTVTLFQGGGNVQGAGTSIAAFTRSNVDAFTTYDETLSGGQADSITDYTDLYLEFKANTA